MSQSKSKPISKSKLNATVKTTGKSKTKAKAVAVSAKVVPSVHATVFRFNPTMDFTPRTHDYHLTLKAGESVLELLERIKHHSDGSLTFRSSCGTGACGTCGVKVNGKLVLGCLTQVKEHLDAHGNIRIDPLSENDVKKDLVCDEAAFFEQFKEVMPWIESRPHEHVRKHQMLSSEVDQLGKAQECIACGLCNANAVADLNTDLGPAAFVKGYRYARDVRDGDVSRLPTLKQHLPVHYSLEKANLCPRDIAPGDKIAWIKKQKESATHLKPKSKK